MYEKTVTIFDYYESATTGDAYWYPHVLSDVDLIKNGKILPWVPPKEWKMQINNALEDTITFSDESFFWEGEWTGGTVTDGDYRSGFYQYMNENKDNVFKITSVGGPYALIPHFEILGK